MDKVCKAVFDEVRRDGDEALRKYTWYFDRVRLGRFEVTEEEFQEADRLLQQCRMAKCTPSRCSSSQVCMNSSYCRRV